MTVANLAGTWQSYWAGRSNLGLGTQVKPDVEKRFSMPWSHPAQRMREFVDALHAIRLGRTDPRASTAVQHDMLMTLMFTPEPIRHRFPKRCSSPPSASR